MTQAENLKRTLHVQDIERQRLARELHDGIGQMLNALNFKINELVKDSQDRQALTHMVDETRTEIRRLSNHLMPTVLSDFGLTAALRLLAKNSLQLSGVFIDLALKLEDESPRLEPALEMAIYRIAQEALSNVMKHAKTREMRIALEETEGHLQLKISDAGVGFDTAQLANCPESHTRHGLRNMCARAESFGGTLTLTSRKGHGTEILAHFPLS